MNNCAYVQKLIQLNDKFDYQKIDIPNIDHYTYLYIDYTYIHIDHQNYFQCIFITRML